MCGGACIPPPRGHKYKQPQQDGRAALAVALVCMTAFIGVLLYGAVVISSIEQASLVATAPVKKCLKYETRTAMRYLPGVMGIGHAGVGSMRMVTERHCVEYEQ